MAEDAVCLADYCDIMRCDVLLIQDPKIVYPEIVNTDIEIWREASGYSKALAATGPRDVAKYTVKSLGSVPKRSENQQITTERCQQAEAPNNGKFDFIYLTKNIILLLFIYIYINTRTKYYILKILYNDFNL